MKKLRILCLHGYGTNADFLKKQTEPIEKLLANQCEFYYVDGPYQAPHNFVVDQKVLKLIKGATLSWFPQQSAKFNTQKFFNAFNQVKNVIQKPSQYYDGIMGFSQGAVLAHLLLRGRESGKFDWQILQKIKFCIIVSGNYYNWPGLNNHNSLNIPSLHIISPQDFLYSKSVVTTTQFLNPTILRHHYGHRLPKLNINEKVLVKKFIRAQKNDKDDVELLYSKL